MKKNRLLAVILAGTMCLIMGNTVWAEEVFTDGISEQTGMFSAEELENQEMFSSGSEAEEGTEGLVYEYVEERDSYTVVKGINKDSVYIPASYEGKPVMEIATGAFKDFDEIHTDKCNRDKFNYF